MSSRGSPPAAPASRARASPRPSPPRSPRTPRRARASSRGCRRSRSSSRARARAARPRSARCRPPASRSPACATSPHRHTTAAAHASGGGSNNLARDTSPQCKQCRREGQKLFLKGERCLTDKCGVERRSYPPGEHGRGRQKQSEYRVQLREKQKARRYYGVLEAQFRTYYAKASNQQGITGENLLRILECRFDNVLVRLGFAASRRQARQMIRHGHWSINGRRVDIPSYQVRDNDVITYRPGSGAEQVIRDATELVAQVPAWLQADHDQLTAKVLRKPERAEIAAPVQEQLIVELYSK